MSQNIYVEEITLSPVGESSGDVPLAYCVVVDGKRSPLYFSRRDAEEAVANALVQSTHAPAD